MDYDKVLGIITELIDKQVKSVEKLSELYTTIVRQQQQAMYGEPVTPVISSSTLKKLRKDLDAARDANCTTVMFNDRMVTLPYAEYLLVTYK